MSLPDDQTNLPGPFDGDPGDTRQRIIIEAAKLFAKEGYARSTTRALAAAAGITEVTLFRYFESKDKLFEAAVQRLGGPAVANTLDTMQAGEDYRAELLRMATFIMKLMQERKSLIRVILCEASHFPVIRDLVAINPRALRHSLQRYLERLVEQKRIRPINTAAAAQGLMGTIFAYNLMSEILSNQADEGLPPDQFIETTVDIFIRGISLEE